MRGAYKKLAVICVTGTLVACAPKPAPIPPPKPVIVVPPAIPPRPYPPGGASAVTRIPPFAIDGVRETPNRWLSRDEAIWNFRSALNVAAINCRGPIWGQIATDYNQLLTVHKTRLAQVTKAVDTEYKVKYPGQNALRVRDTKSTELYNYFALPPVKQEFCDAAMVKTKEALLVPSAAFSEYAVGALVDLDGIFIRFFDAYAKYERDLADWNQRYGPPPAVYAPQPVITTGVGPITPAITPPPVKPAMTPVTNTLPAKKP
jgi:hypothetical protein